MSGSKKGEHRGNARKRQHETPNDVMRDGVRRPPTRGSRNVPSIEDRIEVARTLHGNSGQVRDMHPREVMLDNMHYSMQAAYDWQDWVMKAAAEPLTPATLAKIARAEREIERYRAMASEDAFKVAPYIHPRLSAMAVGGNAGKSDVDIIQALLEDIDARQRDPKLIEHRIEAAEQQSGDE